MIRLQGVYPPRDNEILRTARKSQKCPRILGNVALVPRRCYGGQWTDCALTVIGAGELG